MVWEVDEKKLFNTVTHLYERPLNHPSPFRAFLSQRHLFDFLQKDEGPASVSELNLENVGGIFMVLLIGIVLGGLMAAAEHIWNKFKAQAK